MHGRDSVVEFEAGDILLMQLQLQCVVWLCMAQHCSLKHDQAKYLDVSV